MIESYDGLCGIIASFASSGNRIRCTYEIGHGGSCSFEKYRNQFRIFGGCGADDYRRWYLNKTDKHGIKRGFIDSVVYAKKQPLIVINHDGVIERR